MPNAIATYLKSENNNDDATNTIFDVLSEIAESVQEDLEELVGISNDKKTFISAPTKIFILILNTNVNTVDRIKKIVKIVIETTLKVCQE